MFKKGILILLILLFTIGFVSAEDNLTSSDSEDALAGTSFEDVKTQIDEAEEGSEIELNDTYYVDYSNSDVVINKSITVKGTDDNLIMSNDYLKINVSKGDVTFKQLNFAEQSNEFRPFLVNHGNLTIINCTFKNVRLFENYGTLKIIDCEFENYTRLTNTKGDMQIINSAIDCGDYGQIVNYGNILSISNSTLKNCAMYLHAGTNILSESRFISNGDSLENFQIAMSLTARNCTIDNYRFMAEKKTKSYTFEGFDFANSSIEINCENLKFRHCSFYRSNVDQFEWEDQFNYDMNYCDVISSNLYGRGKHTFKNMNFENFTIPYSDVSFICDNCSFKNSIFEENFLNMASAATIQITNSKIINISCAESLINFEEGDKYITIKNNIFENNTSENLMYWFNDITYNSQYQKWTTYQSTVDISNNILMNNLNKDGDFSKIHMTGNYDYIFKNTKYSYKMNFDNNFLGYNMNNKIELQLIPIWELDGEFGKYIYYTPLKWVNLDISKTADQFNLKFINTDKATVKMPTTTFSVKDKKTGEILLANITVKDGVGSFKLNKTLDEIYILNEASQIVNKPKANLTYTIVGDSYDYIQITAHLNNQGKAIKSQIAFEVLHGDDAEVELYMTNKKGDAILYKYDSEYPRYSVNTLDDGSVKNFKLQISFANKEFGLSQIIINNFAIKKIPFDITVKPIKTTYNKQEKYSFKATKSSKKAVTECMVAIDIYKNKKWVNTVYGEIKNGVCSWKLPKLNVGTYKVTFTSSSDHYSLSKKTVSLKISKAKASVKAPKVKSKFKKSKYFKVTVKANKKAVKKVVVKVKVFTGKKSKTYTIKTNNKGVAKLNTKKLKVGKHKVVISSGNSNYKISAKSKITIKK